VVDLTKPQFDGWKASLVKKSENKEGVRKSKDTANRVLTMLKAFLNHAWNDEKNAIPSDQAWRKVKPFKGVSRPRDVRFSPPQAKKLISNIEDTKFADLVEGGYVTGARYEELTGAKVSHFDRNGRTLTVGERELLKGLLLLCDFRHVADEIAGASAYTDMTRIGGDFRQAFAACVLNAPI